MTEPPLASQSGRLRRWQTVLLMAAGFGGGFAVIMAAIVGGWVWHESRPTKPKPWDAKAIVATFDYPETESGEPEGSVGFRPYIIVVYYTLQNTTDYDYTMPAQEQLEVDGKLKRQRSLIGSNDLVTLDKERVFIPAKQRRRFAVHLHHPVKELFGPDKLAEEQGDQADHGPPVVFKPGQILSMSDLEELSRAGTRAYMRKEFTNLDGFVVYDSTNRYQINLPNGW